MVADDHPPPRNSGESGAAPRAARRSRQKRGIKTEEAILEATLRSVAARGIAETSLELIAADVGVAKSSILWHFGSKEGLLLRVAERAFTALEQGPAQEVLALPTMRERGAAMWQVYLDTIKNRPEVRALVLYLIFASGDGRPQLRARLRQLFQSMRALFAAGLEGIVADPSMRQHLATLAIAALDGIFLQWLLDPQALDLDALEAQIRFVSNVAPALVAAIAGTLGVTIGDDGSPASKPSTR